MKIKDFKEKEGAYIIKISKFICAEKKINLSLLGKRLDNPFCMLWQQFDDYYEVKMNKYWAIPFFDKYDLTDNDIEIYKSKKRTIKVKLNNKRSIGVHRYKKVIVDRIHPDTKRAEMGKGANNSWYNKEDYTIIK